MSETGELPCLYCHAEPAGTRAKPCCEANKDVANLVEAADALAAALNWYADPRHYAPGEVIGGGIRFANAVACDRGARAAGVLADECRLAPDVATRRNAGVPAGGDMAF